MCFGECQVDASRGVVETPRCVACPEGITRSVVLRLCREHNLPHAERDLSLAEFYRADEMFCTGTMGELASVIELDGRPIADGKPGPVTAQLSKWFGELTAREGVMVV